MRVLNKACAVASTVLLTVTLAACSVDEPSDVGEAPLVVGETVCDTTDATGDLLAQICEEGVLTVSTDPAYPPQSSVDEETGEYLGFDIDVATAIAARLGVEVQWETPAWEVLTAGSWNDRWDISVGSITPTNDRQEVLHFTTPYYYTPAVVVVHSDNGSITNLKKDLDGAKIGVCAGCTYDQFLTESLVIKGFDFKFIIEDAEVSGYDTDKTALKDLALGDGARLDAVITSLTTAQGFIADGNPVKIVGEPVFFEPLAVAFDKSATLDPESLLAAVNQIIADMHSDGTLTEFSQKWYDGADLTKQ